MHTYHIYTVQFCRFWSPITDLRHYCAFGVNLAVFLGLGLFDGLARSAMGQKRSNFQGLRLWASWLWVFCVWNPPQKTKNKGWRFWSRIARIRQVCAFVVVWVGWRFGCAGWAGTVAKRAKNALENCPAGSPKQWVQLAEHRLEKSVLSNE